MKSQSIGILHPGEMGISLAAGAQNSGHTVLWASADRSPATRQRAEKLGLTDAGSLTELCARCDVLVSVCPPHAAEALAEQVKAAGFRGLYVDANAISPGRVQRMQGTLAAAGIDLVDGGIIGGPAWQPGTVLYLAGRRAAEAAVCFSAGPLEAHLLDGDVGAASALKMCYAAFTKGTTALLCAILAAANELGVGDALHQHWERDDPGFTARTTQRARRVTAKAWRFEGEMGEIAATFEEAGLPGGFHLAAAEIYRRLAHFKDADTPALEDVLQALTGSPDA
jgi:3-hydroxyisobutyrate dehydrogenase-like beta-hydroxyacid dehydrogenase